MSLEQPSQVPPLTPDIEADPDAPTPEFAQALAEHEGGAGAAATPAPAEKTEKAVKVGAKVRGRVVEVGDDHVLVDFGGRSEGVAETRHFRNDDGTLKIEKDQEIELFVVKLGDQVALAPTFKSEAGAAMTALREAHKAGAPVTGKVTGTNTGGLTVDLGGARGFCPVSQIDLGFVQNPAEYVGRTLEFLVTKIEDDRKGAVLSRKSLLQKAEKAAAKQRLATLKAGDELDGTVRRLEPFGAFVDLGGMDGLVHVSEIAHERVGHPKEVLREGERVRVRVLELKGGGEGKPKIALSIKATKPDPWTGVAERFQAGQRLEGIVARLADFGAFVTIAPGVDGLVHVSEAALHRVKHVKDVLAAGDKVEVVIKSVEPDKKRIALSIREALGGMPASASRTPNVGEIAEGKVAGIKPFGVFVDLPAFGSRASGMIPREESGVPRGTELDTAFTVGQDVRVEILPPKEGKIRLRLEGVQSQARTEESFGGAASGGGPSGGGMSGMGGSGGGGGGGRGGERRDRGERGERGDRGPRSDRRDRGAGGGSSRRDHDRDRDHDRERPARGGSSGARTTTVATSRSDDSPSPMALALRKAMEAAKARAGGEGA